MTLLSIAMIAAAGFLAGIVNAVAGGGTFFTFAALVASGLPAIEANATSAVALVPASLATAAAYRAEMRLYWRELVPFALIGGVGGLIGGYLLISIDNDQFRPLVPWLLALATVLFALGGRIRELVAPWVGKVGTRARTFTYVLMGIVAIYGGFFGAGMGIMMLAALAIIEGGDFHKANTIKNMVALLAQATAVVLLIAGGLVHWPETLVTMAAAVIAGYVGVSLARKVPEAVMRWVVVVVGTLLTAIFFLRG